MSGRAARRRALVLVAAALILGAPAQAPALASEAAHKMAEKFAGEESSKTQEAERKAQAAKKLEADRKAERARGEQDAQAKAQAQAQKQAKAKAAKEAAEAKRAAAKAQAAREARRAAEQRKADEADMLARARREADERAAATIEAGLASEARRLIEEAERERAKAEALLAGQGAPPEPAKTAQELGKTESATAAADATLARQRAEETRRLAEKLKRVRQIREARLAAQERREAEAARNPATVEAAPAPAAEVAASPPPPRPSVDAAAPSAKPEPARVAEREPVPMPPPATVAAPAEPPAKVLAGADQPAEAFPAKSPGGLRETRVTVLLVLEPGTYGIRRNGPKVADPLICTLEGCYVSAGADQPARFLPGRKGLGFGNTWGGRAGACRHSLGCVFRDVELGQVPAYLQPVDLHILKHDRRRGHVVTADSGCASEFGRLSCRHGVYADDYVMWIVPESVADAVGPAVLQRAVADGLNGPRSAQLEPMRR